jgi:hypothetical protein
MKVGDIVKSHDFVGVDNTYMIGRVVGVYERDGTFRARVLKVVFAGTEQKKKVPDYFTAPLPGKMMFDRPDFERVVVLESCGV